MAENTPKTDETKPVEKNKKDDFGKDLGPKLIFLAIGFILGLLLYCVIFGCDCDIRGYEEITFTGADGESIIVSTDGGTATITKNGVPQDCEWNCIPKKDGGGEPGIGPGGEPGLKNGGGKLPPGKTWDDYTCDDLEGYQCSPGTCPPNYKCDTLISKTEPAAYCDCVPENGGNKTPGDAMPDYIIPKVELVCGEQYNNISVTIKNQGTKEIPLNAWDIMQVDFFTDPGGQKFPGSIQLDQNDLIQLCPNFLKPGESCTYKVAIGGTGLSDPSACADISDNISESDENNNCNNLIKECPMPPDSSGNLPDFKMTDIGASCDGDYDVQTHTYSNDKISSLRFWPMNMGPGEANVALSGRFSLLVNGNIIMDDQMADLNPFCPELFKVMNMNCELDIMQLYFGNTLIAKIKHGDTIEICLDYQNAVVEGDESNNCLTQLINCPTNEGGPEPDGTCQGDFEATGFCGGECEFEGHIGSCEAIDAACHCIVPDSGPGPEPEPEPEPGPEPGPEYVNCRDVYANSDICAGDCILSDQTEGQCYFDGPNGCYCAEIGYEPPGGSDPEPEPCVNEDYPCSDDGDCCSGLNCCYGYCTTRSC